MKTTFNNLLEHESVDTEEAEATPSSYHEGSPGFINVAASTEGHLEHFSLSNIMKGKSFFKASLTIPARAPLRVIRKLHLPSPTLCQRNCKR